MVYQKNPTKASLASTPAPGTAKPSENISKKGVSIKVFKPTLPHGIHEDAKEFVSATNLPIRQRLGWKKDERYHSVMKFRAPLHVEMALKFGAMPSSIDLRHACPGVYDQGDLGSCTANAGGALAEFLMLKEGHEAFIPSRLFVYYNERVIEGSVSDDAGATIADCLKVLGTNGCPHEALWWYNTVKYAVKPNHGVYVDGLKHVVTGIYQVNQNLNDMRSVLASGYPIEFGFVVYSSFDNIKADGIMPMPDITKETVEGGHAVLIVGYDNARRAFIVRNSWGPAWGDGGYFYMPYNFAIDTSMASDFWTATGIN